VYGSTPGSTRTTLSASTTGSARRTSTMVAARYLPHRRPRVSARRPCRRHSTSTSSVDVCRSPSHRFKFQTRRARTRARKPGHALAFARASLVAFFALLTSISRAVAPFSRREARATILRAQDDLYQVFSRTYQKPLVLRCLPIQIGWYAGTLVRWYKKSCTRCCRPTVHSYLTRIAKLT
jgi:hypothetical protein